MEIKTPPFMVIDISKDSWARLCENHLGAYDQFMGWLLEEGLDPLQFTRVEVYDSGGPVDGLALWAAVYDTKRERTAVGLARLPPMQVRMIVGVYPEAEQVESTKSDILFKNGQVVDPTPPFPPLSPREITDVMEEEMQNEQRAEFAHRVHSVAHGSVDMFGEPIYPWDSLSRCCKRAWETTAAAITAEVRGEQVVRETLAMSANQAEALGALAKALDALPKRCPYHGSATDPRGYPYPWTREACCDAGLPAQRRKRAEEAMAKITRMVGE